MLFDVENQTLIENPGLTVRSGKIVSRGSADVDTSDARVLQLSASQVILPGFIDLHAHYAVDVFDEGRVEESSDGEITSACRICTVFFPR